MIAVPNDVLEELRTHHQEHVLAWWDDLNVSQRRKLVEQLRSIDFAQLQTLFANAEENYLLPAAHRIAPLPRPEIDPASRMQFQQRGEEELRRGTVAFLVVAGGLGSRLGFERPKGMFPITPIAQKSLFQLQAEKTLAMRRHFGAPIPFLVMTSPATDKETRDFFEDHRCFGLPDDEVLFFCQGTMPALDLRTGRLLLESKGELCLGPNGHGGTLIALADSGLLDDLASRGIRTISYFQVDNRLIDLADRFFLGQHVAQNAEVSSKVVPNEKPKDKLGNVVLVDGRCSIIEYSDLPESMANETDRQGRLLYWAGSTAIHLFDVAFLRRVTHDRVKIPWHSSRKRVPYLDEHGRRVEPEQENALRLERFIFDLLPLAERWTVVVASKKEFEPLKNAIGPNSPASVRQALCDQAADWLEYAGVNLKRDAEDRAILPLEISTLYALDAEELAAKGLYLH